MLDRAYRKHSTLKESKIVEPLIHYTILQRLKGASCLLHTQLSSKRKIIVSNLLQALLVMCGVSSQTTTKLNSTKFAVCALYLSLLKKLARAQLQ
jgi:hypothetical protein